MRLILLAVLAMFVSQAQARTALTPSTIDFYVSKSGNDANDCRLATPCLTIQRAVDNVKQNYDSNCLRAWIHIGPGTYAGWQDYESQVGCQPLGGGPTVIAGMNGNLGSDCTDMSQVVIESPTGVNAISYDGNAKATIICMTVSAPGASAIYATNGAIIELGLVRIGTANIQIAADAGGSIIVTSTVRFLQGAAYGVYANIGGMVNVVPGITLIFDSGIGYANQFAFAINGGIVVVPVSQITVSGNPSGQKCFASILGIVNAAGSNGSLPGTSACGSNYGGQVY